MSRSNGTTHKRMKTHMEVRWASQLGICGLVCCFALTAQAQFLVSNLDNTGDDIGWIAGYNGKLANSFTTGSGGAGWDLGSVTLDLMEYGSVVGDLQVFLAADATGEPGTKIVDLNGPNPDGQTPVNYSYTPASITLLAPSTTYWIVTDGPGTIVDNYAWNRTDDTSETGLAGWSIGQTAYTDEFGSWEPLTIGPDEDDFPVLFSINVPEPHEYTLLASLGLLGFAYWRRRR